MILLETHRLILRNWRDDDLDIFHRLNSDETVMKYFPFRRSRIEAAEVMAKIRSDIETDGYGWAAIELNQTGQVIGMTGIHQINTDMPDAPATEIGWRFLPEFWGKGFATEAANAWLRFAFTTLDLDRIIAFAVPINPASTAVMKRIGMQHYPELDFDHPGVSEDYAHLKRHLFFAITKAEFIKSGA